MPQFENTDILGRILKATLGVISRRTSDAYANVVIGNAIRKIANKYTFLNSIKIQGTQYIEVYDIVTIEEDINNVEQKKIINAVNEFLESITKSMGKDAGYYFLREIKGSFPYDFEEKIRELGIDLDYLQFKFLTDLKQSSKYHMKNTEIIRNVMKILFEILDRDLGRDVSYRLMSELVERLSTEYNIFKYVKINDIRSIQNVDIVTINEDINAVESDVVGVAIQKIIQEIFNSFTDQGGFSFIEKLKSHLNAEYLMKLGELGINLDVIQLKKELVVKHVLIALVDVLSKSSNQNYAVMVVNNVLKKFELKFEYLKNIKISSENISEENKRVFVSPEIESVNSSELGRGIQKIVEDITFSLGDAAGPYFIKNFRKQLGKAYILRIEELGVNLHMIDLKRNLTW